VEVRTKAEDTKVEQKIKAEARTKAVVVDRR